LARRHRRCEHGKTTIANRSRDGNEDRTYDRIGQRSMSSMPRGGLAFWRRVCDDHARLEQGDPSMVTFASNRGSGVRAVGVLVCLLLAPHLAAAATCTWTGHGGGGNGNWSSAVNWDNCGGAHPVPMNGDSLVFPTGAHNTFIVNDIVGLILTGIQVIGPGLFGTSYGIGGNGVIFTAGSELRFNAAPSTIGVGDGPQFSVPINLGAGGAVVISNTGTVSARVFGPINLSGQLLIFNPIEADLTGDSGIDGTGAITKTGGKTLFLGGLGVSGFDGPFQIQSGTVRAVSNRAFGSINHGPTVASGATLELTALVTMPNPLTLAGGTLASVTGVNPGTNTWMRPATPTPHSFIH